VGKLVKENPMHRTNSIPPLGDHSTLVRTTMPAPMGELTLVASPRGLRAVLWDGELPADSDIVVASGGGRAASILAEAVCQLEEYFAGTRTEFDLPLDPVGTEFQQAAWGELRKIPFGQTISYGEQARRLGDANKSRAVGAANGRNPISIVVPCHRVIGANGALTGFAAGLDVKQWLLQHEQGGQGRLTLV
jgi:methylated-DNA-[protein]-cysteine S-methyltransferase